jgi:nitrogen fixation/metabolism regulation signal transduction histidine kinase
VSRQGQSHETRVGLYALLAGLPALAALFFLLFGEPHAAKLRWTFASLSVAALAGFALAVRERVGHSLRTVSGLLSALREQDFSMRGHVVGDDAYADVLQEINALADTLRQQRLGAMEATELLARVMENIDVAVFALEEAGQLVLANRAGARLLGAETAERVVGRSATELGLGACLEGDAPRTFAGRFPGGGGPWELRRGSFRPLGRERTLVVLTDLRRALREEERQAWQRLVRVLGHEINNSLTPIQSIAGSLRGVLGRPVRPADADEDLARGLEVIERRADGLARFLSTYARLARLPAPRLADVELEPLVRRVVALETRLGVTVAGDPGTRVRADADQLEPLLINLLRNAVDATLEVGGAGVRVAWTDLVDTVELRVEDDGPGLSETANLFVPFFTTKPGGSGIGLVLSRQIAEAHGGTLVLENRGGGARGAVARVALPSVR